MLRCRDIVQHADRYLAGEMGFWPRVGFRLHLLFCRFCRRYLHQLRIVSGVSAGLVAEPVTDEDRIDSVMALLTSEHQGDKSRLAGKGECGCPDHYPDNRG